MRMLILKQTPRAPVSIYFVVINFKSCVEEVLVEHFYFFFCSFGVHFYLTKLILNALEIVFFRNVLGGSIFIFK